MRKIATLGPYIFYAKQIIAPFSFVNKMGRQHKRQTFHPGNPESIELFILTGSASPGSLKCLHTLFNEVIFSSYMNTDTSQQLRKSQT